MIEDEDNLEKKGLDSTSYIKNLKPQTFDKNNNMSSRNVENANEEEEEVNPFKNDVLEKLTSMQKFQVKMI
jgi:hypothetical protein